MRPRRSRARGAPGQPPADLLTGPFPITATCSGCGGQIRLEHRLQHAVPHASRGGVVIIPSGVAAAPGIAWPMSSMLPPMGALTSAPGTARAHVRAVLARWGLADLTEVCELAVSELTTNAVEASTGPTGRPLYVNGRMPVVRVRLFSDGGAAAHRGLGPGDGLPRTTPGGQRRRDRARPAPGRRADARPVGLAAGEGPAKVVWAELTAELADPEHERAPPGRRNRRGARVRVQSHRSEHG